MASEDWRVDENARTRNADTDGTPDVVATNDGTIWIFECTTLEAREWADEYIDIPPHQRIGPFGHGRFAVEHRYAGAIVEGFADAGFRVRVE